MSEIQRRQIAWYYYESELTVKEIAVMFDTTTRLVNKIALEYTEWYV